MFLSPTRKKKCTPHRNSANLSFYSTEKPEASPAPARNPVVSERDTDTTTPPPVAERPGRDTTPCLSGDTDRRLLVTTSSDSISALDPRFYFVVQSLLEFTRIVSVGVREWFTQRICVQLMEGWMERNHDDAVSQICDMHDRLRVIDLVR